MSGVAGDFFVFKCAAADLGEDLASVQAAAVLANDNCRSMGVALGPCSLPQTATLNFEIGPEDMEIHGEPGMRREKLGSDAVTDVLMEAILRSWAFARAIA